MTTTIRRRLEWPDTDAAGIWHYSSVFRFAEAAEAQLHRELGIIDRTFGQTPRVRVECDFHAPVRFDDEVTVTVTVQNVGRTSATYDVLIERGGAEIVAVCRIVSVLVDDHRRATPWPDDVAAALRGDDAP